MFSSVHIPTIIINTRREINHKKNEIVSTLSYIIEKIKKIFSDLIYSTPKSETEIDIKKRLTLQKLNLEKEINEAQIGLLYILKLKLTGLIYLNINFNCTLNKVLFSDSEYIDKDSEISTEIKNVIENYDTYLKQRYLIKENFIDKLTSKKEIQDESNHILLIYKEMTKKLNELQKKIPPTCMEYKKALIRAVQAFNEANLKQKMIFSNNSTNHYAHSIEFNLKKAQDQLKATNQQLTDIVTS